MKKNGNGVNQAPNTVELFRAVREENIAAVQGLLKKKVDVNVVDQADPLKPTPLLIACEKQNIKLVSMLLNPKLKPRPANVNVENAIGKRPIWWAAKYGNIELAEQLLRCNVEVNFIDKETGCAPLYRAVLTNSTEVCRILVSHKADVNLRRLGLNAEAESPLIKAVQLDNYDVCVLLINSLCNIQAKTQDGLTALHYAVAYRRYKIAELLLQNRIKLHRASVHGLTAMGIAIEHYNPAMCRLLIEFGYKMDKKYSWGETLLEHAINIHSERCAMTFVHWGCSLSKTKKQTVSYFTMAANEGLATLVKLLVMIKPVFLNEDWLLKKQLPLALFRKPDLCDWLFKVGEKPLPLTDLCRAKIFRYLGKYAISKVKELPLPEKIQTFLKYEEYFGEDTYQEKPLDLDECPFDCLTVCPKRDCPDLDISSDSDTEF